MGINFIIEVPILETAIPSLLDVTQSTMRG